MDQDISHLQSRTDSPANTLKYVAVYCGSSPGGRPEYVEAARELGRLLAQRHIGLVYGGGRVGLMGQVADAALEAGGEVIGVITEQLSAMELAHRKLSKLHVVDSMHDRKLRMAELSDGFIALPGGYGTIEEFFEVLTWEQLGIHHKPCGLLNVCGYYNKIIEFLDGAVGEKFVHEINRRMLLVDETPAGLLQQMERYESPKETKAAWVLELTRSLKKHPPAS